MAKVAICKELGGYTVRKYTSLLFGVHSLGAAFDKNDNFEWCTWQNIKNYCVFDTLDSAREFAESLPREVIEIVSI